MTGPSGRTVVVQVADSCSDCATGSLALSPAAQKLVLGDADAAGAQLTWKSADCASVGRKKTQPRPRIQVRSRKLELGAAEKGDQQ